ncbi:MAG: RHS repeat domain-containing protein, partial [Planctomycetaceae bacterium]
TKTTFDRLNRAVTVYTGYGTDASYSDIFTVTGDVILEQMETVFDDGGNAIQETRRQRYHNAPASQTGALGSPSLTPNARVTYAAGYPDPLGRSQANANYGTNGGAVFTRSSTIPARSDTVLVTSQSYDDAGNLLETIDPAGMVTRFGYDAAGSRTQVIENYVASPPSSSSSSGTGCGPSADVNRTTNLTYTPDGLVASLQAINASTGNQTTTYVYGTTLADSDVASSVLLRSVIYPDSTGGSDQVWLTYNRQAQRTSLTDQNGSVHQYDYDLLGRLTQDRVTTLAANVDGAIRRIETAYEVRGLVSRITSNDSPTVGAGSTVNEVKLAYNNFGQSIKTYQAHSGAVDVMTTPSVQMGYANGSMNTVRPTSLTYPNGRTLSFDYGSSGGIDDSASRIETIVDDPTNGSAHLAEYSYLGLATVAEQTSPQPAIQFTLLGNLTPDGDIYTALDRFGRMKQSLWKRSGTALSNVEYGYDRASNRTWRENPVAKANSAEYDWKYGYDGLQRLKDGQRGTLNGTQSGITNPQFGQCWTLDATGNWSAFKQSNNGTAWSLEQTRTANAVNELTTINATAGEQWADPKYDANGNMTTVPRPGLNRPSWANLTTDQWAALTVNDWSRMEVAPTFRATYDAWNRLVKLTDGGNGETVQENQYDGRGYRIVSKTYTDGALSETRHAYFTDQWQCIEERLGTSSTPDRQFVWGVRYIDDLILRDRSVSGGSLNERLYALQDANWNVTTLTDSTGAVQERYEYDPYGVTTVLAPDFTIRAGSNFAWETTYCGYRWDQSTGLFAVRNRFYHPRLGIWITPEPLPLPLDDRLQANYRNLYAFDYSKPLVYVDPDGLWPLFAVTGLIGAVAGAVIGGVVGAVRTGTLGGAASGALRGAVAGGITGATLGLVAPAIAGAGVGGVLGGAIAGGTASAVGETATQGLEMAIGTRTALDPWQIGTSTVVGTITGGAFCRPALPGSQPVTHWSPQGASPTQLQPGMWVQTGGQTPLNYLKTGTPQLGYPYANALTQNVPREALKNPGGWEACKALIGQYIYQP